MLQLTEEKTAWASRLDTEEPALASSTCRPPSHAVGTLPVGKAERFPQQT